MKKILLILYLLTNMLCSFSQEKAFGSFELLYAIPQEIYGSDWPDFDVGNTFVCNDTLFTILCKTTMRRRFRCNRVIRIR